MTEVLPPRAHRFVVLDGLRGLAAFVIIADHVPSVVIGPLVPGRYLAVDFFFVLSGFVLSYAFGKRLAEGLSPLAFLKARLVRFYPLYLAATILAALLAYHAVARGWRTDPANFPLALVLNLAFLPNPPTFSTDLFPFLGPAWSLFFELLINFVYAVIAVWLTTTRLAFILLATAPILALAVVYIGGDGGWAWHNVGAAFPRVTFSFFAGVMIYRLRAVWTPPAVPAVLAFACLALVFAVPAQGMWRPAFDLFAMIVIFPLLVAWGAQAKAGPRATQVFAFMGMLSYGVYVFQVPIRDGLEAGLGSVFRLRLEDLGDGAIFLVLLASVAATVLAHYLYDFPVRRWLTSHPT